MTAFDPEKITFFAKTDARGQEHTFGIKARDRQRHMYVVGKTGMGKSTLLENMAAQDIANGEGMAFIDPHGSAAETLLDYVPEHRIDDVVYFAPFDLDHPVSFNVMEDVGPDKRHLVVSGLMSTFKKIWVDAWSARMEYILTNALLALIEYPDTTLLSVNRMFVDKEYRDKVVDYVKDPAVKAYWTEEFANYTERFAAEALPAIQNKIGQFTGNPLIRNIIGQPESSFDIREIMDGKKILLMNLSKGLIGETNANLLGSMLTTRIYLAAMSRADLPVEQMKQMPNFYFYVDEFQSFANSTFANILSEARKYHLNLIIAHQYIAQMEEEVRDAVFGNVGTTVSFRVGPFDGEVLETVFSPQFTGTDLVNLGFAQIYLTLMIDGIGSSPFSATTLPPVQRPFNSSRNQVISRSRTLYAKDREAVEKLVEETQVPDVGSSKPKKAGGKKGGNKPKGQGGNDKPNRGPQTSEDLKAVLAGMVQGGTATKASVLDSRETQSKNHFTKAQPVVEKTDNSKESSAPQSNGAQPEKEVRATTANISKSDNAAIASEVVSDDAVVAEEAPAPAQTHARVESEVEVLDTHIAEVKQQTDTHKPAPDRAVSKSATMNRDNVAKKPSTKPNGPAHNALAAELARFRDLPENQPAASVSQPVPASKPAPEAVPEAAKAAAAEENQRAPAVRESNKPDKKPNSRPRLSKPALHQKRTNDDSFTALRTLTPKQPKKVLETNEHKDALRAALADVMAGESQAEENIGVKEVAEPRTNETKQATKTAFRSEVKQEVSRETKTDMRQEAAREAAKHVVKEDANKVAREISEQDTQRKTVVADQSPDIAQPATASQPKVTVVKVVPPDTAPPTVAVSKVEPAPALDTPARANPLDPKKIKKMLQVSKHERSPLNP